MPGQQQVGACLVGVLSIQGKDIAPAGGTVFLAGAGVFVVGCNDDGDGRIEGGSEQQKARGLVRPLDGQRLRQQVVDSGQDPGQPRGGIPPHSQPGRCPPDKRQRQQPDPPGGFLLQRLPFPSSVGMGALHGVGFFPFRSLLPQLWQRLFQVDIGRAFLDGEMFGKFCPQFLAGLPIRDE